LRQKSSFNDKLKKLSWRIDVETKTRDSKSDLNNTIAIVEMVLGKVRVKILGTTLLQRLNEIFVVLANPLVFKHFNKLSAHIWQTQITIGLV